MKSDVLNGTPPFLIKKSYNHLTYLKAPPTKKFEANETLDYTTNISANFVDVDATVDKFSLSLDLLLPAGGTTDVLVGFVGNVACSVAARIHFNIAVDGVNVAADDGITYAYISSSEEQVAFVYLIRNVAGGSGRNFKLRWKTTAGTATLYAGAGTSQRDVHPQFWVREVS